MSAASIHAKRLISSNDHQELRAEMPHLNHELPEYASVKWKNLGKVSLTLLGKGEYLRVANNPKSALAGLPLPEIQAILEEAMRSVESTSLTIETKALEAASFGRSDYVNVGFLLQSETLDAERDKLTDTLDMLSGINNYWRPFLPHLSLATVEKKYSDQTIPGFRKIMPKIIKFHPVQIDVS